MNIKTCDLIFVGSFFYAFSTNIQNNYAKLSIEN